VSCIAFDADSVNALLALGDKDGDHWPECQARDDFAFRSLASIRAKSKAEAIAAFRYLADSNHTDDTETESILLSLIG